MTPICVLFVLKNIDVKKKIGSGWVEFKIIFVVMETGDIGGIQPSVSNSSQDNPRDRRYTSEKGAKSIRNHENA